MKIVYCGYDFFHSCLRYLLSNDHHIQKVFTFNCDNRFNYNNYIYKICRQRSLPITEDPISVAAIKKLVDEGCELLITAGYRYKVPNLDKLNIKGINVHPTLLPEGRGVWPLPWIILKRLTKGGVTIHKLMDEYDAGEILSQTPIEITPHETLESLSCKVQMEAIALLNTVMADFDNQWENARAQDKSKASFWPMPDRQDQMLDWSKSVEEIDRICRAFGKSGAIAFFDNQWWYVYDVDVWKQDHTEKPGKVVHKTNTEMVVAASDGYVVMRYFQAMANSPG